MMTRDPATHTATAVDLLSAACQRNPYPTWQQLRSRTPIYWSPQLNSWVLTAYDDIQQALHSPALSAARFHTPKPSNGRPVNRRLQQVMEFLSHWLVAVDPPHHTQLRSLLAHAFTPRRIKELQPRIQHIAAALIEQVSTQGGMDVYTQYAHPLSVQVIAEILGVPATARDQLRRWSRAIVGFGGAGGVAALNSLHAAIEEMVIYFRALIQERRLRPAGDFISDLLHAGELASPEAEEQLIANCAFLLFVGHDTTANAIQNGVFTYLQRGYPGTVDVEEILRFDTVVPHVVRVAREEVWLSTTRIGAGERVTLFLGAANRDPAHFSQPDRFDGERSNQRHLSFGHGIHYCLGAALARLEISIAIDTLFTHLPTLRWTDEFAEAFGSAPIYRGATLPVEF